MNLYLFGKHFASMGRRLLKQTAIHVKVSYGRYEGNIAEGETDWTDALASQISEQITEGVDRLHDEG